MGGWCEKTESCRMHYANRKRQKTKGGPRHALQKKQRRVLRRFDGDEALFVYKRRKTGWKIEDRVLAIRYVSEVFLLNLCHSTGSLARSVPWNKRSRRRSLRLLFRFRSFYHQGEIGD